MCVKVSGCVVHARECVACVCLHVFVIQLFSLQAWSTIVHLLIPNISQLEASLNSFATVLDADEVLLFEKATFLVSNFVC